MGALLLHLFPSIAFLIVLLLAWKKWEWIGAVGFLGWAVFYVCFATARGLDWISYLLVGGIPTMIGLFFLVGWIWRKQIRG